MSITIAADRASRSISAAILSTAMLLSLPALAQAGDFVSLQAGGLMSSGLEIKIDLETGDALKRSTPFGSYPAGEEPVWTEVQRHLRPDELQSLREVIKKSLADGLRSKACDDEDRKNREQVRPPPLRPVIADSIISLTVLIDGQYGSTPERDCTSAAFNELWDATYKAASGPAAPPAIVPP